MGDFRSAFEAVQKASDMRATLLGYHEDTAEGYHWLALAQSAMEGCSGIFVEGVATEEGTFNKRSLPISLTI